MPLTLTTRLVSLEQGHAVLKERMTTNARLLEKIDGNVEEIGTTVTVLSTKMEALASQKASFSAWGMAVIAALIGAFGAFIGVAYAK
jgi:hypothetical protein